MGVAEKIGEINPRYRDAEAFQKDKKIKPIAVWEHKIVYDSTSEQLEPVYFWIIDFLNEALRIPTEKVEDNFSASFGGGFFSEIGQKATKMQEEGMKIMGTINTLIRTIINLIYDLKDFEIRLAQYEKTRDKDPKIAESALLSLKNVWLDKVDMPQKGQGSIHQMTYQLGFSTLRDAFFAAKTIKDVEKLDINERVKRVLLPRFSEFEEWRNRSEQELTKRFEIEKNYLRSEVAALKLYTRWAKPYLKAAEELRMRAGKTNDHGRITDPDLVTAFNSMIMELTLFSKDKLNISKAIVEKKLPQAFKKYKFKRDYYKCLLINLKFRGIPYRSPQGHYLFGGRVEVSFRSYVLNSDELNYLYQELDKDDLSTALALVEETTESSLKQMYEDLEHFIKEEKPGEKKEKEKKPELKLEDIRKDDFRESVLRKFLEQEAATLCFTIYDVYKKSHGMATFAGPEFETEEIRSVFSKNV